MTAAPETTRRSFFGKASTAAVVGVVGTSFVQPSLADDEAPVAAPVAEVAPAPAPAPPPAKANYGTFPVPAADEWGISGKDYYADAAKVTRHMQYATQMDKGTPNMDTINKNMKKEMVDFVSFYRRFSNVAGKQSFSTLYTAINVLAGHYTSYGTKFPVPEKRRKRLYQEYAEIEKNIKKGR
eukprot:CAMPEP_0205914526 /NCGR_PEP_ID=MMETSP1325-20131115/7279_1 /ASSEMBLY_ACC=CAM_ASM_000708 /TAXON_ID=236786 /ORGANISM="Florenciella sp., Strain RCC1007" /LENGTH=181 /DNA_ID=CAMNT_0053281579 /DNA_START=35 /DNA_END=580 /DNA_ORIENTATION=+